MARSDSDWFTDEDESEGDDSGNEPTASYTRLKHIINQLEEGDRIAVDILVDAAEVVTTYHDETPHKETIRTVEAKAVVEGPRGRNYELTAGTFSAHEKLVEMRPTDGNGRKRVRHIERLDDDEQTTRWDPNIERARGQPPPDPSLDHQEEWEIATICKRFCAGSRADETVACAATDESVRLGDRHLYVTARRDPYPRREWHSPVFEHYVLADADALVAWFANGGADSGTAESSAESEDAGGEHEHDSA